MKSKLPHLRSLIIIFLAHLFVATTAIAQAPLKMSYQAVLRNSADNFIQNSTVGMKISILQGSASGIVVYAETQTPTTNSNGLVSIEIGTGTVTTGEFANIDWANGPYFLKTETDPDGGTNYSITGTSQLLSVPYALHAAMADRISNYAVSQQAPSTTEAAPTNITENSATLNNIVNGKGFYTTVSFEYGTTTAYGNNVTPTQSPVTGSSDVTVSTNLTGLLSGTTYHYRVKATNAVNVTNSPDMNFTTGCTIPQVTTTDISGIMALTSTGGGNVTYDGGAAITARGVCWSTSTTPTIALSTKTTDGTGSGSFSSNLAGLTPNTTYYVRSYATNAVGTSYGNEVSFTTQTGIISLSTTKITIPDYKGTTASAANTITSDGGSSVTARGICWSTSTGPTIALSTKTTDGTGTGSFTSSLTALSPGTKYYVRSYATNEIGTSYGNEVIFSYGPIAAGTVKDIDGNVYHAITLGTQTWLVENLKTTKYNDGTSIPNVTDNATWSGLTTGAYCNYNNDATNVAKYGRLYNHYAVTNTHKLAPTGWHVASDAEWTAIQNYLIANGYNYDGSTTGNNIAKSMASTADWIATATTGTIGTDLTKNNSAGFSAAPAGSRYNNGTFAGLGSNTYLWSSTELGSSNAFMRYLTNGSSALNTGLGGYYPKNYGFSVRCVKD